MNRTITIENSRLKAVIYPERGANLIQLYDKKYEFDILRKPQNLTDFETDSPYLYGMPILFPPNRISEAKFEFEEREYKFPVNEKETGCFVHGTLHCEEFKVSEYKESYIKLEYSPTKDKPYPGYYDGFKMIVEYTLDDGKMVQKVEITNTSEHNMPIGIGFHSTFNTDINSKVEVRAKVINEFIRDENYLPTGETVVDSVLQKELSSGYIVESDNVSSLLELGDNHTIEINLGDFKVNYDIDNKYKYLMLFNVGSKGKYICIEPQSWISNCPNVENRNKYGFSFIKSNESRSYETCIYLSET